MRLKFAGEFNRSRSVLRDCHLMSPEFRELRFRLGRINVVIDDQDSTNCRFTRTGFRQNY